MWHGTYGLHAYNAPIVPFLRVDSSPLESFHQSVHTFFANPSHWDWRTRAVRWNQGIENNLWRAGKKIRSWSCSKVIAHHASLEMFPISSSLDYLCESKYPLKSIEGVFISVWVPYTPVVLELLGFSSEVDFVFELNEKRASVLNCRLHHSSRWPRRENFKVE